MIAQFRKLPIKHRPRPDDLPGVSGPARPGRRTKILTKRLAAGDIAIIDHVDLDRVSADALIACQVAAVVNAAASISGRYPNPGPQLLMKAGIPLVDEAGPDLFARVAEGKTVRLDGDTLYAGDEIVAKGKVQTAESVAAAMAEAKAGMAAQLRAFVTNTLAYMTRDGELIIAGITGPELRTKIEGRHVLVVVRGYHLREDLAALRSYIREFKPLMIGVDGGADTLLAAGYRPHLIVGDMDSVSDSGLRCGAELVVHAYPDGRAPGLARVQRLGLPAVLFPSPGTSEDLALLMADEKGASLIVAVGTHYTLDEFLDKGRGGHSSTWLTRLRVGGKLVDAKGVSRLYRPRVSGWALMVLVLAAVATILVAMAVIPAGQIFLRYLSTQWDAVRYWLAGLL
ncbi:MAG TPA: putative cytokinetic ring protein SteA [Streptosporangiaceae bacterium]|nr:putative cytokinetic ring protein SteA [Streptosporangiaceae bacterium]